MRINFPFPVKVLPELFILVVFAGIYSATLHIFVYNSDFAPTGVDGIATMIQYLWGFNAGYTYLIFDIPFLVVAYFVLNRKYVFYTAIFSVAQSLFILFFTHIGLYQYYDPTGSYIMAAMFSGLIRGVCVSVALWFGGTTGGVDIIVSLIQKRMEHVNFEKILLVVNCIIISLSFFVYGSNLDPILLSIISAYCFSKAIEVLLKNTRSALEFKIITDHPDELLQVILNELKHGVTVVPVVGGYTNNKKIMLLCVVNPRELVIFKRIIKRFDKTFAYFGNVSDVIGYFDRSRNKE